MRREVKPLSGNPNPQGNTLDNVGFVYFNDPDGNAWVVQQTPTRD